MLTVVLKIFNHLLHHLVYSNNSENFIFFCFYLFLERVEANFKIGSTLPEPN